MTRVYKMSPFKRGKEEVRQFKKKVKWASNYE